MVSAVDACLGSAYALLQWACASVGAILVTLNPAYRINELVSVLCPTHPRGVMMLSGDFSPFGCAATTRS